MTDKDAEIVESCLSNLSEEAQDEIKILEERFTKNLKERRGKSAGFGNVSFLELLGALIRCGVLPLDHPERFKRARRNFPHD